MIKIGEMDKPDFSSLYPSIIRSYNINRGTESILLSDGSGPRIMDDTICNKHQRGEHIVLRCTKCDKWFTTKNIEYIGARSIFLNYEKSNCQTMVK